MCRTSKPLRTSELEMETDVKEVGLYSENVALRIFLLGIKDIMTFASTMGQEFSPD